MEQNIRQHLDTYIGSTGKLMETCREICDLVASGRAQEVTLAEWQAYDAALYGDILPAHYEKSYADPAYAVSAFGREWGQLLSALLYEVRTMIPLAYDAREEGLELRRELFESFCELIGDAEALPDIGEGIALLRGYYEAHMEAERAGLFYEQVAERENRAVRLIREADFSDPRYLYRFGMHVSDNELKSSEHLNALPDEVIERMAQTFVDGYCEGFAANGRDLSIKETVRVYYDLGFERMVRRAIGLFEEHGLRVMCTRAYAGIFFSPNDMPTGGFLGSRDTDQYDYDHKDDIALFLDEDFQKMRLNAVRAAFEPIAHEARVYGGPAVIETFGRALFVPVQKKEAIRLSTAQQALVSEYRVQAGIIQNEFIPGDERSFTVIAFPVAEIGARYAEIFDEILKVNTLDVALYREVQQKIIDVLDTGTHCIVRGMGDNRTDLKVMLQQVADPAHETVFENCVADVNIPVGEVFTSPVLKGTEGTLHVTGVYLNELYYKDLFFTFRDGRVTDYGCANFETEAEGRSYIEENILHHHKTLPIGEFAIGTNTTAYVVARRYHIEQKLPILIAEKTGPHFALGDTCYSYEEDVVTYNPDGKRLIAKDNEISIKRRETPESAYFSCHTDITIPYDEMGDLAAVTASGEEIPIIENGRFVLPGTEPLNEAFRAG